MAPLEPEESNFAGYKAVVLCATDTCDTVFATDICDLSAASRSIDPR